MARQELAQVLWFFTCYMLSFSIILSHQISNDVSERNKRLLIFRICMITDDINIRETMFLTVAYHWNSSTSHLVIIKCHSTVC